MKLSNRVLVPAIILSIVSIILVIYGVSTMAAHPMDPATGEHLRQKKEGAADIFTMLGNIAIFCACISYWWFRYKKKLASPLPIVKKLAKKIYAVHTYTGWIALSLVVIHAVYFLVTDRSNPKLLTGIAASLPMVGLAVYGWLYRKVRHKSMRNAHFLLSNLLLILLLIHAGGFFILMVVITLASWVGIWIMEKKQTGVRYSP